MRSYEDEAQCDIYLSPSPLLKHYRPLVTVLVGQVVEQLGEPDGIIAFDPSSFPKRGTHSVGLSLIHI